MARCCRRRISRGQFPCRVQHGSNLREGAAGRVIETGNDIDRLQWPNAKVSLGQSFPALRVFQVNRALQIFSGVVSAVAELPPHEPARLPASKGVFLISDPMPCAHCAPSRK